MTVANKISIASETVLYAAECIRSGERELALDVIRDWGSLSSEQSQAIEAIIRKLGTLPLRPRDLYRAEANMIEVLNLKPNEEKPTFYRMQELYHRIEWGEKTTLHIKDILNPSYPFANFALEDILECYPELETLELDRVSKDLPSIIKGIATYCPKFKCLKYSASAAISDDVINLFSPLIKTLIWNPPQNGYTDDRQCRGHYLETWAKLPHLTELIFEDSNCLTVFHMSRFLEHAIRLYFANFTRLEKLTIELKIDRAEYSPDEKLVLLIAAIPNLQAIDVRNSDLTYEGVRQFALAKRQTLRQMTLSLSDGLNKSQFAQLQTEMPTILFTLVEK